MKNTALLLCICLFVLVGCTAEKPADSNAAANSTEDSGKGKKVSNYEEMKEFKGLDELKNAYDWQTGEADILYLDVLEGSGREVQKEDWIVAFYTLWDAEGNMLQSNMQDIPFVTEVGVGKLIKGWDAMVPGMKDGGVRRLIVPGEMAYGENPPPGIAPNATLVFELKIVASGTKGAGN